MPNPIKQFFADVIDFVKHLATEEPAHAVGAVAAILTVVVAQLNVAGVHTWQAVVPVVLAAVIRKFVYSPGSFNRATDVISEVSRLVLEDVRAANAGQAPPPAGPAA